MKDKSEAQLVLETHLKELGLLFWEEYPFCEDRKWRADYALLENGAKVLIEIEGAVWTQGRHTRGSGFEKDCVKYNFAAALGYKVFRFPTGQVLRGEAKEFLKKHWLGQ